MPRTFLYDKVSKGSVTPRLRVNELVDVGLLHEEISSTPPMTKYINLTPLGRKVAEHLIQIEQLLDEKV